MGGDPSPEEVEELMQLIERYESSTKGFGDVPDELRVRRRQRCAAAAAVLASSCSPWPPTCMKELMDNLKRSKGQPTDEAAAQDVTPQPG